MRKIVFSFEPLTHKSIEAVLELHAGGLFVGQANLEKSDIKRARAGGLDVMVEVGLFASKDWWNKYPESRPVTSSGKLLESEDWYYGVCPNNPSIRNYYLKRIEEIVSSFPIDGLWLDFIRYPGHWEVPEPHIPDTCYCQNCLQLFFKSFGRNLPRSFGESVKVIKQNSGSWINFRENQITGFVKDVKKIVQDSGRQIELGVFLMPDERRSRAVAQNVANISSVVDTLAPMLYHAMCGEPVEWLGRQMRWAFGFNKSVLPIIQTEDKPRNLPPGEFRRALMLATTPPSIGVTTLFLEDLLKNKDKVKVFRDL